MRGAIYMLAIIGLAVLTGAVVDSHRVAEAAPVPVKGPASADVPLSAPAKACVLRAVDCTNDKDAREEVQCAAIAMASGPAVVVRSKDQPRSFLVIVWRDSCK